MVWHQTRCYFWLNQKLSLDADINRAYNVYKERVTGADAFMTIRHFLSEQMWEPDSDLNVLCSAEYTWTSRIQTEVSSDRRYKKKSIERSVVNQVPWCTCAVRFCSNCHRLYRRWSHTRKWHEGRGRHPVTGERSFTGGQGKMGCDWL